MYLNYMCLTMNGVHLLPRVLVIQSSDKILLRSDILQSRLW